MKINQPAQRTLYDLLLAFQEPSELLVALSKTQNAATSFEWLRNACGGTAEALEMQNLTALLPNLRQQFHTVIQAHGAAPNVQPQLPREVQEDAQSAIVATYFRKAIDASMPRSCSPQTPETQDFRVLIEEPCGSGKSRMSVMSFIELAKLASECRALSFTETTLDKYEALIKEFRCLSNQQRQQIVAALENCQNILLVAPSTETAKQLFLEWKLALFFHGATCVGFGIGDSTTVGSLQFTTDTALLRSRAQAMTETPADFRVLASTYASLQQFQELKALFPVDFCVLDEAHRLAGSPAEQTAEIQNWSRNLQFEALPARFRLNMTASTKMYLSDSGTSMVSPPSLKNEKSTVCFGTFCHSFPHAEAIDRGYIADFGILTTVDSGTPAVMYTKICEHPEIARITASSSLRRLSRDRYLHELVSDAVALQHLRDHAARKKIVVYHETIQRSKDFVVVMQALDTLTGKSGELFHVDSKQTSASREKILNRFRQRGGTAKILTNCETLKEGLDIPDIDTIYFGQLSQSGVEILQITGRALRHFGEKQSLLVIPLRNDEQQLKNACELVSTLLSLRYNRKILCRGTGGIWTTASNAEWHSRNVTRLELGQQSQQSFFVSESRFQSELKHAFLRKRALRDLNYRLRVIQQAALEVVRIRAKLPASANAAEVLKSLPVDAFLSYGFKRCPSIETFREWCTSFHPEYLPVERLFLSTLSAAKTLDFSFDGVRLSQSETIQLLSASASMLSSAELLQTLTTVWRVGYDTWRKDSSVIQTNPSTPLRIPKNVALFLSADACREFVSNACAFLSEADHESFRAFMQKTAFVSIESKLQLTQSAELQKMIVDEMTFQIARQNGVLNFDAFSKKDSVLRLACIRNAELKFARLHADKPFKKSLTV